MGLYISLDDVRVRLIGKVRFTSDDEDDNKLHESLANRLIAEAEGQVEYDLSPRYFAPFKTCDEQPFKNLPDRPTKNYIRTLCELQSCIRILEEDFGDGTVVDADKYADKLRKRYKMMIDQLMEKRKDGSVAAHGFQYPPLPGLKLNYMNESADDGFMGQVLSTSSGDGSYPAKQINDPSENFWWNNFDE